MRIKVKLYANLRKFTSSLNDSGEIDLLEGERIKDLFNRLGMDFDLYMIVTVNSLRAELETPLKNGDEVTIFPMVAGG